MSERSERTTDTERFPAIGADTETVYEAIFRTIEDVVFLIDVEEMDNDYQFRFRRNNASHREQTGFSEDQMRGQTPQELLGEKQGTAVAANYRRCVETREAIEYEETLDLPGGTSHWQTKLTPIIEDGHVTHIVGVARDITDQKVQQRKLQRMTSQFETVLETMSAAVFLKDTNGEYLLMNQACGELFGVNDDEIAGLTDEDLFPPEAANKARSDDQRVIENGETIEIEETVPTAAGNTVRLTRKSPVYENGEIIALCGVSTDITEQRQREQETQRLKERFELAVEGANLGVWDWDMTTDEVEFNEQWARMLGYSSDEIEPHIEEWEQRVHPDDVDAVEAKLQDHIAGEADYYDAEHRMRTATGDWKWIRDVGKIAERNEDGEPVRAVGIHLDIDDRKTYQRQLEKEREMFTQGPAVVFQWREAEGWPVEYVSGNISDVLGYTVEELQTGAVTYSDIIHDEDRERVLEEVAEHSEEGTEQFSHEPYRVVTADGTVRWVLDYTKNIRQDGEITHRQGYLIDITERRQNEMYLEKAQEVADIGWWRKEMSSDRIYWSENIYEMWDTEGEVGYLDHGRFLEFIHPEDEDQVDRAWQAALEGGTYDIEHRIITGNGDVKWMREVAEFTRDAAGDPIEAVGIVQDITERKTREQALKETKQRLSLALEGTNTGVWEWNIETDEVVWTESMERLFGIEPNTFEGTYEAFAEHVHPDDIPALETELERAISTGDSLQTEYRIQKEDTKQLWGEARAELVEKSDGSRRMIGIVTDITDRKESEKSLEAAQEGLRRIIDLVPDLIFVKNREGEYLLTNEATAEAYGLTPAEVEGKREADIIPNVNDPTEFRADDVEVIESGEPKEIAEEEFTTADGETRILQTTKIPYRIPGSGEDAVLGYARDVTDLKRYERTLEEQRDNLKLLNQIVRHDIRNNLQLVVGYTELLSDSLSDEESREFAQQVMDSAQEAVEITETARDVTEVLLQVGADQTPTRLRRTLLTQIDQVRTNHERTTVTIENQIPDVDVLADEMLEAVFRNILTNAVVHNDKELTEIVVSTHVSEESVRVRIADNGPGISDDDRERIFKEGERGLDSEGTGLGLYLVQTLVDRYGGNVWSEDNEPEGTVFVIELPLVT